MLSFLKTRPIITRFINPKESRSIYQLSKLNQDNQQTLECNNQIQNYQTCQNDQNDQTNQIDQINSTVQTNRTYQTEQDQQDHLNNESKRKDLLSLVLRLSTLKPRKSYETRTHGDNEISILKVNKRSLLIYDENSPFVNKTIECLRKNLDLNLEEAKDLFFQFGFLRDQDFKWLFSDTKLLDLELKKIKQNLNNEQVKIDLHSIKMYESYLKTRLSIFKLIGLTCSFSSLKSFTMIMCQTESNLKELNLIERNVNLLEHIIDQLNFDDVLKNKIRSECSEPTLTMYELLGKISEIYLLSNFDFKLDTIRMPLIYIDLLNISKVIEFINLKIKEFDIEIASKKSKKNRIQSLYRTKSLIKIDYDVIKLIDDYLKDNGLDFIWKHLINSKTIDSSFYLLLSTQVNKFLSKIEFLIRHRVPAKLINNHFHLFFTKQNQLKFFFNKFGDSFLEYDDIPFALTRHHQIIQKYSELSDEYKTDLSFVEFMKKYIRS